MAEEDKKVDGIKEGMSFEDLQGLFKSQGLRVVSESDYTTKAEAGNDLKLWKSKAGGAKTPEELETRLGRLAELEKTEEDRANKNKSALQKAQEETEALKAEKDNLSQRYEMVTRENLVREAISQLNLPLDLRFVNMTRVSEINLDTIGSDEGEKEKLVTIITDGFSDQQKVVNMHLGKQGEETKKETALSHPNLLGINQRKGSEEKDKGGKPPPAGFGFGAKTF